MSSLFDNISAYQQGYNTYYKSPLYKSQLENQQAQTEEGEPEEQTGSSIQQNTPAIDWTRPDSNISPETYQEYQSGLLNGNPNKLRQERLQEATARNKRILDGQNAYSKNAEQNWEALGLTPLEREEAIQESNRISTLSNEERLANFDARRKGNYETTLDDVDFAQAMSTMNIADIRGIYGKDAAEYAYQMRRNATQAASLAGARGVADNNFISWGNLSDSALSVGAKALDTIGSVQDARDLAVGTATHDDEAITKLATEDNFWHKGANWLRGKQSASIHEAEARAAQKDILLDMREQQDIQENRTKDQETSDAKTSAWLSKQSNNISNLFDEKSTLFTKSAEILGDIVVGGIVAKGSAMLARGATESAVKSFVKKELLDAAKAKGLDAAKTAEGQAIKDLVEDRISSVGKQQAQNNISTYGKQALAKEANTSRIGLNEKINPLKESIESKAKSDIAKSELVQQQIKGVGKEAERKAFSEGKDIARQRAEEILSSIGSKAATVGVTAHGANQEAMDSLKSGYSLVADMDDKQFSNTNKGKEIVDNLNQKYKVNSLEDGLKNPEYKADYLKAKDALAVEAAKDAYTSTFAASAVVNTFTSGLEKKIGGVESKAKSFKEHIKGFLGNTSKEMGEEFVESFSGEFNPKDSANKAVDSQVYGPMDKALSEGVKGAIVAGLGSGGLSAAPLGKSTVKTGVNKASAELAKAINAVNKKNELKQAEAQATQTQSDKDVDTAGSDNSEHEEHYKTSKANADAFTSKAKEYEEAFNGINDDSGRYSDEDKQRFEDILSERDEAIVKNREANDAYAQKIFDSTPEGQRSKEILKESKEAVDRLNSLVNNPKATNEEKTEAVNKINSLKQEMASIQAAAQKHYEEFNSRPEIDFWNKQDTREEMKDAEVINSAQNQFEFDDNDVGSSKRTKATSLQQQFDFVDNHKDLSANDKKRIKTKMAKNFIEAVRSINTKEQANTDNIYDKWNDVNKSVSSALKLLNDEDLHLEPNEKNLLVKGLQHIQAEAKRIGNFKPEHKPTSAKASLASFEKLIGSTNRRERADGTKVQMRGLLDYVQSALNNKGKLPVGDLAELMHFNLTQHGKYQEVKRIMDEYNAYKAGKAEVTPDVKNLLVGKPVKISNPYLKESNNTIKQDATAEDREATSFTDINKLKNYYNALQREIAGTADLLNTLEKIQDKKSIKVSGSKATKVAQETKVKEATKEEKESSELKQEDLNLESSDDNGNSKVIYTNESRINGLNSTIKSWAKNFLKIVQLPEDFNFTEQQWNALYEFANAILSRKNSIALSDYVDEGKTTVIKYLVDYITKVQKGIGSYSESTNETIEVKNNTTNSKIEIDSAKTDTTSMDKLNTEALTNMVNKGSNVVSTKPKGKYIWAKAPMTGLLDFRSPFKTNHEYMHWILTGKTLDGKDFEKDRANSIRKALKQNAGKDVAVVANKTDFVSYADVLDFLMNSDKSPLNTAIKTNVLKDLPLQELVNIWSIATGSHVESLIDEDLLGEYRLKGLDVRIENGKPVVRNALSNPDFKIQDKSKVLDIVEENALLHPNSVKGIAEAIFDKNGKEVNTADEDFRGSFNYLNGLGLVVRSLRTYLESSSKPALEGVDNAKSFMSGLFNFVTINNTDTGLEMGYTADLVVAMARTLSQGITSSRSTGRGKDIRKQYTDDGQKDLYILDISDVPAISVKSSQEEAFEGINAGSNKIKFKSKVKAIAVTDSNLTSLGTEKNKFVQELGESVLKDLGVRIKDDSQDQILYNGMAMAIGTQLLDFLVDNKLVDINRLFIYPSAGKFKSTDMVTVDHISFKMDKHYALSGRYKDFVNKEMSASEANNTIQSLNIDSNNSKGNALYKAMALMERYKDTTAGKFIEPEANKDIHGYSREKPFETTDKLNANKLSTGKNKNQQATTQAHNNLEYRVASTEDEKGIYEFLSPDNEANRNFYKRFIGYNLENDFKDITAYTAEVKKSINAGIDRSFDVLDRTIYKDDKDLPIYLKHKALASLRTFVSSILTPQGDKTHRLLVIPKQKDNTWGFNATGMTSENIVDKMLNALKNPQDYEHDEWVTFTGYGIALAQGLDVKVSKLSEEDSLKKLQKILSEEPVKTIIKELASAIKDSKEPNMKLIDALNSDYKTPLGFNALFTLAQLDAGVSRISNGKFQPLISLEADGIGNGIYNGVKQFVSKLTSEYFSILKRTGNVLMDNLSAKIDNLEDMSKITGSKELFTEDETGKLADVYEVASAEISSSISEVFKETTAENKAMANYANVPFAKAVFDTKDGKTNLENLVKWAYETRTKAIEKKNVAMLEVANDTLKFTSAARALGLILLTGNADSSLFTKPLKEINSFEIKRALAKLGVTPQNYGGRVDGVTNQVVKGVKDSLLNRYNTLLTEVNKSTELTDAVKKQYKSLSLALSLVGLELPLNEGFTLDELRDYLTNFEGFNINESRIINNNVKYSLGTVMDESIQKVYSVQFDNVAALTTLDNILFNNFLLEFNDRLRNFIKDRNTKNGWVDKSGKVLDPRANDFVTGKELKFDILGNMTNSPQVATAMSDNSQLVNDLIHTGNTILNQAITTENSNKTSVYGLTQNARLNQFISSTIHGQWQTYSSAGASLLISSLVASESRTMGETIQALAKEGISLTQVFDGVEIPPHLREKVANLLNEITDRIHSENSLMDAYYHKANRSNIQAVFNEPLTEETKSLIKEYLDTNKLKLNAQLLTLMQAAVSSAQVVNKLGGVVLGLPIIGNTESRLRPKFSDALDGLTRGESVVDVGSFIPTSPKEEEQFRIFMGLLSADPTAISDYAITALESLRNAAATNVAIKKIESEYLPSKVNQFGGISDGYNKNQDNPKAKATFKRFIEFSKTADDNKFKNNSNALMDFIEQDEIIQKEIANTKAEYIKANPLAQNIDSLSTEYESKPLDEAINDLDIEGSTNLGNTFQLLRNSILRMVKGRGLTHFTNKDAFINALAKHVNMTEALKAEITTSVAYYHPKVGVYTTNSVNTSDFLHELVHAILNNFIRDFVAGQHGYNNNLNQDQNNAMKLMNKVMMDVINAFTHDSTVIDLLDKIAENGKFDVNYSFSQTHSAFKAAIANMLYVRSEDFIKNNPIEVVVVAQAKAMQEFFAYSLSEHDALNHLQYHGIKGRTKFLNESGIQTTLDKFKNLISKVMDSFLTLFGIKKGKFTESYLADLNRAITVLSQDSKVDLGEGSSKVSSDFSSITGSSNISSKHAKFLNDIVSEAQSNFNTLKQYDYQDEYKLIQDGLTKDSDAVLNNLRTSTTIPFSQAEEEAFILMNKVFEATNQANDFFGRNSSDTLKHVVDNVDAKAFNKEFGSNAYNQVFNSMDSNALLALMVTNERIKNYVEAIPVTKDYKAKINDAINNLRYDRNIDVVSDSALENLGRLGASLNFKDKLSKSQEDMLKLDNFNEQVAKQNTIALTKEVAKNIPNDKLSSLIYMAGVEYVSGNPRFSEDGELGKAIQTWLNNRVITRDKNDVINSVARLFKGVYSKTQHIYQAQNVQSIIVDNAREKVGNAINDTIEKSFKNEITDAQDKAMSNILLKGTFARLSVKTYNKADLVGLLNNKSTRDHTLNLLRNDLSKAMKGQFASKQLIDDAMDYIEWQTSGLAEKLYKGTSKANGAKSYIAANTKVIANGGGIVDMHAISSMIEPIIKEMVAIKGLEHAESSDIKELTDLINSDFNGVKHVINEQQELERVQTDSFEYNEAFGIDGYVHSRKNPFKDYKVLDPKSETDAKTIKRLMVLGYKPKARLSNGLVVFHNHNATVKNFSVGMFGINESSRLGMSSNGNLINSGGKSTRTKDIGLDYFRANIKGNRNAYASLQDDSNSHIVVTTEDSYEITDLPKYLKDQLVEENEAGYESIGNYYARLVAERRTVAENKKNVDLLNKHYSMETDKRRFAHVTKKSTGVFKDFYNSLPKTTRDYIDSVGGVYVDKYEANNIMGMKAVNFTDILLEDGDFLPKPIKQAIKATVNAVSKDMLGVEPAIALNYLERGLKEVTSLGKDFALVRSIIVPMQNLVSNVIHLGMQGVPPQMIPALMHEGYVEAKNYNKLQSEFVGINHRLSLPNLSKEEKDKLNARKKVIQTALERNPVRPLIQAGILTSISDLSKETVKDDDPYSLLSKLGNKTGILPLRESMPTPIKNLMMMKGSTAHNLMSDTMDFGDFVAKYVLYKHLRNNKKYAHTDAINVIREEFVNYSTNKGPIYDILNATGMLWFTNYKFAIQKVIYNNWKNNTLRTLAVLTGGKGIEAADIPVVSDLIQTVPSQIFWTDYSGYHFQASNIVESFGSHWLTKLLFD